MKSFKQFMNEQKTSYKIYCDMDGVLVDFMVGIKKELNLSTREPTQDEISTFLGTYRGSHVDFWADLNWMSDGKKLWNTLKDLNVEILTACPSQCKMQPSVAKGKQKWCKQNLKKSSGINISTRRGKVKFAAPTHILIDDYYKNTNEWKAAGGKAITHVSSGSTLSQLKKILIG